MSARPSAVLAVYGAALAQGLTLVSFPASSAVLREAHGLSDAQYGLIFLPQVAAAVAGSVLGGALAQRIGLQRLLWIALLVNAFSQLALAATAWLPNGAAVAALSLGTAALGLGFGLLGAPLNSFPPLFFPQRRETAVVIVHTLVGAGLMLGPVWLSIIGARQGWQAFPLSLATLCGLLAARAAPLDFGVSAIAPKTERVRGLSPATTGTFWVFASIAVLYAFAEGTYSNWAVVYLQEGKRLPAASAALALSMFWGGLVGGRLLVSALVLRVPAALIWLSLPLLMILAFLLLPYADTPARGIALFALSGSACSAFFPLSVALISARFPRHVAWVSSMLIAALMVGVGLGSFAIGALRGMLSFEHLYQWSALYPAAVLALAAPLLARGSLRAPTSS